MELSLFLTGLTREGNATVGRDLVPFLPPDVREALQILWGHYELDCQDLPSTPPPFHPEAAIWAAGYLYRAVQLVLLRQQEPAAKLPAVFAGTITPSVIYSADLTLRYLPVLMRFAQELPPEDPLLQEIRHTAACWPFSSIGMDVDVLPAAESMVLNNQLLRQVYIDRIIGLQDYRRAGNTAVAPLLEAAMGAHASVLWPGYAVTSLSH